MLTDTVISASTPLPPYMDMQKHGSGQKVKNKDISWAHSSVFHTAVVGIKKESGALEPICMIEVIYLPRRSSGSSKQPTAECLLHRPKWTMTNGEIFQENVIHGMKMSNLQPADPNSWLFLNEP